MNQQPGQRRATSPDIALFDRIVQAVISHLVFILTHSRIQCRCQLVEQWEVSHEATCVGGYISVLSQRAGSGVQDCCVLLDPWVQDSRLFAVGSWDFVPMSDVRHGDSG